MPGWQRKFTLATQTIQYTVGGLQRKFTLSETIQTQNTAIKERLNILDTNQQQRGIDNNGKSSLQRPQLRQSVMQQNLDFI